MTQIRWDDSLLIGIPEIDQQHKSLVKIINSLLQAIAEGQSEKKIDDLLSWLREYTVLHFNAEEEFMKKIGYPKLGQHSQEHAHLKEKVKGYQYARFRSEDLSQGEIKIMLSEWLLKHILENDFDIKAFLQSTEEEE